MDASPFAKVYYDSDVQETYMRGKDMVWADTLSKAQLSQHLVAGSNENMEILYSQQFAFETVEMRQVVDGPLVGSAKHPQSKPKAYRVAVRQRTVQYRKHPSCHYYAKQPP